MEGGQAQPEEFEEQEFREWPVTEWGGVTLDGPGEDWVVVDFMGVEGEGGEAEKEGRRGCELESKFGCMGCCFVLFRFYFIFSSPFLILVYWFIHYNILLSYFYYCIGEAELTGDRVWYLWQ